MDAQAGIKSIEVGGRLLQALAASSGPVPLKDLAARARLSPSAAHHYLVSYRRLGLVRQEPDNLGYSIGPFAVELGMAAIGRSNPMAEAHALLEKVRNRLDQSVMLATWGSYSPVIVSVAESSKPIIMTMRIGATMPLLLSATGWIFASFLPKAIAGPAIQHALQEGRVMKEYRNRQALNRKLAETREARLVGHSGHLLANIAAVSTPLIDVRGQLVAAMTVFGDAQQFDYSLTGAPAEIIKEASLAYTGIAS